MGTGTEERESFARRALQGRSSQPVGGVWFKDRMRGAEGTAPVSMVTGRAQNQRGLMQEDGGEAKGGRCHGNLRAKGGGVGAKGLVITGEASE